MKKAILLFLVTISFLYCRDYKSIRLTELTQQISNTTGQNVVISDTVQKDFSVFLPSFDMSNEKISLKLLFEILDVNQLSYRQFDNIILIYKELPKAEQKEQPEIILTPRVVKYQFLTLSDLQKFLTSAYPDTKFTFLKNRIFFNSTDEDFEMIEKNIKVLDSSYLEANLHFNVLSTSNNLSKNIGTDFKLDIKESDKYINILTSSVKFETTLSSPKNFYAFINLMTAKGYTKLLQNPTVIVRDGGSAMLESTTKIPVLQTTTSTSSTLNSTQNSYKYEDVGMKLNVKNVFISDDVFTFDLEITLETIIDKTLTPTISVKKLVTQISLKNNEPFIIAGIKSDDDYQTTSNIPIIEYIPILGKLTEHNVKESKNETFTIVLNTDLFKD